MVVDDLLPFPVPPYAPQVAAWLALAAAAHFLHVPSLLLYAVHTYIHPDAVPSTGPRTVLRQPGSAAPSGKRGGGAPSASDGSDSCTACASTRPHFVGFHLSLLLPLALLPLALLLPPPCSPAAPLVPLLPLAFLFVALLRQVALASPPRPAHLVASLLAAPVLSSRPFAGSVASLAALPAWRSARLLARHRPAPHRACRPRILRPRAPPPPPRRPRLLRRLHPEVLRFVDGPELEVKLLAAAAGLQLLASSTPRAIHIPSHVPACLAAASERATSSLLQASRRLDLDRRRASSLLP
ncbi:hypothetical protein D1007_35628 [Hordeum vulgare]|nr:hypothetical protein D1007_35628 [Hordeum vulgare]